MATTRTLGYEIGSVAQAKRCVHQACAALTSGQLDKMDASGDKAQANDLIPIVYEYLRDTCSDAAEVLKKQFKKVGGMSFVRAVTFFL